MSPLSDLSEYYPAWVPYKVEGPRYDFECPECHEGSYRQKYGGESYTVIEDEAFAIKDQRVDFHEAMCRNGHTWSVL